MGVQAICLQKFRCYEIAYCIPVLLLFLHRIVEMVNSQREWHPIYQLTWLDLS